MKQLFSPAILLRIEGAVIFALSLFLYSLEGGNWLLYALLLLTPDLSALGYFAGNRIGAYIYNLFHTYLPPALLGAYGLLGQNPLAISVALIWFGHIGLDRMLGFGLKYTTAFKETHFSQV